MLGGFSSEFHDNFFKMMAVRSIMSNRKLVQISYVPRSRGNSNAIKALAGTVISTAVVSYLVLSNSRSDVANVGPEVLAEYRWGDSIRKQIVKSDDNIMYSVQFSGTSRNEYEGKVLDRIVAYDNSRTLELGKLPSFSVIELHFECPKLNPLILSMHDLESATRSNLENLLFDASQTTYLLNHNSATYREAAKAHIELRRMNAHFGEDTAKMHVHAKYPAGFNILFPHHIGDSLLRQAEELVPDTVSTGDPEYLRILTNVLENGLRVGNRSGLQYLYETRHPSVKGSE